MGGAEWGGAAVDPKGVMYINASEMASIATLKDTLRENELALLSPGKRLYTEYCVGCHGADFAGNPASGFPGLVGVGKRRTREAMANLIATGAGRMPGFPMLADGDKQVVIDYVLGLEKAGAGPEPSGPKPVKVFQPYFLNGYVQFLDRDGLPGGQSRRQGNAHGHRPEQWKTALARDARRIQGIDRPGDTANGHSKPTEARSPRLPGCSVHRRHHGRHVSRLRRTDGQNPFGRPSCPAGGNATPCTYEVGGRQYIVVACGGSRVPAQKKGDSFVAFALP